MIFLCDFIGAADLDIYAIGDIFQVGGSGFVVELRGFFPTFVEDTVPKSHLRSACVLGLEALNLAVQRQELMAVNIAFLQEFLSKSWQQNAAAGKILRICGIREDQDGLVYRSGFVV